MSSLQLNPFLSRKTGATEVYLIRHANALPGVETVIPGGGYDVQPLSLLGQQQAQALGNWLASVHFDAIYSSPLRRTQETAAPLAQAQNLIVQLEPDLREVRLNIDLDSFLESDDPASTAKALRERLNEILMRVGKSGKWSSIEGSESGESLRARTVALITQLAARHPGQRIAAFSHGGSINAYLAELLGMEQDLFFPIHNTSVSIVRCQGDQASLITLNELSHLRAALIETED